MSDNEGFVKTMIVTRRVLHQKEITVAMTDGRYAKNEIVVHITGLPPNANIGDIVEETAQGMNLMQQKNPLLPAPSSKSKALIDKTMKAGEKAAEEAEQE